MFGIPNLVFSHIFSRAKSLLGFKVVIVLEVLKKCKIVGGKKVRAVWRDTWVSSV